MKVAVFGTGYVGLVTGACLSEVGHTVVCVDIDAEKVATLQAGETPIYEPGLDDYLQRNIAAGRLQFTLDSALALDGAEVAFIAVGTPPGEDGSADLQYVLQVAETIALGAAESMVVVDKSTVPVGTAEKVAAAIQTILLDRDVSFRLPVVSNPEFLKEGAAINDFMFPDRIIIGSDDSNALEAMKRLYRPFNRKSERLISMDIRSAELTKYAANAMLATKISFINEMANVAERVGADIEAVRKGIGSDPRIGNQFIYAGCGYGGSCFPKDVKALIQSAAEAGYDTELLQAVEAVNGRQKQTLIEKLKAELGTLKGKTVAVWGLAFKPGTDDMREAPSIVLIESLLDQGAIVKAYDPVAMAEARHVINDAAQLSYMANAKLAIDEADALVLVTEWKEFREVDWASIASRMKGHTVIDGRNIYEPHEVTAAGLRYVGVGRLIPDSSV